MRCSRSSGRNRFSQRKPVSAFAGGGLAVQVELAGPPGLHPVLEFQGGGEEGIAAAGRAGHRLSADLQVSGLFHLVGVGDEIGFLRGQRRRGQEKSAQEQEAARQGEGERRAKGHNGPRGRQEYN